MFKVGHRSLLDGGKVCDSLLLKGCRKSPPVQLQLFLEADREKNKTPSRFGLAL